MQFGSMAMTGPCRCRTTGTYCSGDNGRCGASLRFALQHRQQIQADQMRDALFLVGRLFAPELAAEHAGCCQFRREPAPGHLGTAGGWHFSKQVTGFSKRACNIYHVAPRTSNDCCKNVQCAELITMRTPTSTRNVIASFRFATCDNSKICCGFGLERFLHSIESATAMYEATGRYCASPETAQNN